MSVAIKSLKEGTVGTSLADVVDAIGAGKSVVVTSMRFVNTATSEATLNISLQERVEREPAHPAQRHKIACRIFPD